MSLLSMLNSFNDGMKDVSRKLHQSNEVTRVTSELKHHAYAEKCWLEAALKLAKSDVEMKDYMADPTYRRIHAEMSAAADAAFPQDSSDGARPGPIPNFSQTLHHDDPETSERIRCTVEQIRLEREAMLSEIRAYLIANEEACAYFYERVKELGGEHYLPALLPPLSR